ncbi:MAG: UDP-N-acetylmuramate dehydrogenase [Acidimicrobiales bacterium]
MNPASARTTDVALDRIAARLGARARRRAPLAPMCTYRVGGPAGVLVEAERTDDLIDLSAALADDPGPAVPTLVVGRGSNLLVADRGFPGVVVHLGGGFDRIDPARDRGGDPTGVVVLGAAVSLPVAARRLAADGVVEFEWAVGVPGSVGGAVRMNAGGHGSDMAASVRSAELFDLTAGKVTTAGSDDLAFGYRTSSVSPSTVVVSAVLDLAVGDPDQARDRVSEIVAWRRRHQPGGQNAGSVFTNPPGDSAGRLIDAAGLKGFRLGTAEVSTKHANFIQADPGGSADDIHRLIAEVQRRVADTFGIRLECENRLVGFEGTGTDDA